MHIKSKMLLAELNTEPESNLSLRLTVETWGYYIGYSKHVMHIIALIYM